MTFVASDQRRQGDSLTAGSRSARPLPTRPTPASPALASNELRPLMCWLLGSWISALSLGQRAPRSFFAVAPDQWPGDATAGQRLLHGEFAAHGTLGAVGLVDDDSPWQRAEADPLWLADLNSFEWLRDLRDCGDSSGGALAFQFGDDLRAPEWGRAPRCLRRGVLGAWSVALAPAFG